MYFVMLCLLVSYIFMLLMKMSNMFLTDKEKLYSFECGFDPFIIPRNPFSIQFFKIIMIFLLFDVEIILIMPLPLFLQVSMMMKLMILLIILILIIGLFYEWYEGSLEWLN